MTTVDNFCSACGESIKAAAEICPHCGVRQLAAPVSTSSSGKSKGMAIVLALLLGGLGVHKFYLGQMGQGILYLLLCWTGVPAIVALVDLIMYAKLSSDDFKTKYPA